MDPSTLKKILRSQLKSLADSGISHLPVSRGVLKLPQVGTFTTSADDAAILNAAASLGEQVTIEAQRAQSHSPVREAAKPYQPSLVATEVDLRPYANPLVELGARQEGLAEMDRQVRSCTRCEVLAKCRTQTVFGVGSPTARLCFFGEAPGADEDRLGEPFVGAAGQLLDRILTACGLNRQDVYIMNTIKCRPPQNRNPSEAEQANCWEYAEAQLDIIQPEFICCLGRIAAQALLKTDLSISKLRGQFHQYRGSRVIVTYHPAYLLRTPSAKKQTWEDMKIILRAMGMEPAP
jgi:DNA polymerase